ncbi:hypothetical protein [Cryptosporangium arvum]|uniref:hypothetical protein n=1 Tax=Cryptosporangium arvum TaxID=80871 RepID=UPI0004B1A98A|nr:hypothetical protein [Cryptosporangium arvum]
MRRPYLAGLLTGIGAVFLALLVVLVFVWLDENEPLALPGSRNVTRTPSDEVDVPFRGQLPPSVVPPSPPRSVPSEPPPAGVAGACDRVLRHVDTAIGLLRSLPTIDPDLAAWNRNSADLLADVSWAPRSMRQPIRIVHRAVRQALYWFATSDPAPFIQVAEAERARTELHALCDRPQPRPTETSPRAPSPSPSPSTSSPPPDVRV